MRCGTTKAIITETWISEQLTFASYKREKLFPARKNCERSFKVKLAQTGTHKELSIHLHVLCFLLIAHCLKVIQAKIEAIL